MISTIRTVNPDLPFKEKDELLWRDYMQQNGWHFLDNCADIPDTQVLLGTGCRDEFLEVYGFCVETTYTNIEGVTFNKGEWVAQNYPYGCVKISEEVVAWREPITNDTYDKISFKTMIGNDFLGRVLNGLRS